jgi:hypothetical protein
VLGDQPQTTLPALEKTREGGGGVSGPTLLEMSLELGVDPCLHARLHQPLPPTTYVHTYRLHPLFLRYSYFVKLKRTHNPVGARSRVQLQKTKGGLKKKGGPKAAARLFRRRSKELLAEPTPSYPGGGLPWESWEEPLPPELSDEDSQPSKGHAAADLLFEEESQPSKGDAAADLVLEEESGQLDGRAAATKDEFNVDHLVKAEVRGDWMDCGSTWEGSSWEGWRWKHPRKGSLMGLTSLSGASSGGMGRDHGIWLLGVFKSVSARVPLLSLLPARNITRYSLFSCARPVSCAVHRAGSPVVGWGLRSSFALAVRGCLYFA